MQTVSVLRLLSGGFHASFCLVGFGGFGVFSDCAVHRRECFVTGETFVAEGFPESLQLNGGGVCYLQSKAPQIQDLVNVIVQLD